MPPWCMSVLTEYIVPMRASDVQPCTVLHDCSKLFGSILVDAITNCNIETPSMCIAMYMWRHRHDRPVIVRDRDVS